MRGVGRAPSVGEVRWWGVRSGAMARWELALIVSVATLVVGVNKGIIHDRGNTWPSLVLHAGVAGVGVVLLLRVVRGRARRPA